MKRLLPALFSVLLLSPALSACGGGSNVTITAEFKDTAGLFVGNDVGVLGVQVGEVTAIEPAGNKVLVTLEVEPDVRIPADAGAVVVSRSVATDRYVELTPVFKSGATMADGTTIELDKTRTPVEFDELLASLDSLTGAIAGPDGKSNALSEVLKVSATTLDGNGTLISKTVSDLAEALTAVNGGSDDVSGIIGNLDTLTKAMADNDRTVRDFSENISGATQMLNDEHEDLERTFDALSAMLAKVAAFARDHHAEIGDQLEDITSVSQTLVDHQAELAETLEVMPLMMQNVKLAVDDSDRLTMKLRPGDLVPGKIAAETLCGEIPAGLCDSLDFSKLTIFDILDKLAGVGQ